MTNNIKKLISGIFLPALLVAVILGGSAISFFDARLLLSFKLGDSTTSFLNNVVLLPQIIFAVLLLVFLKKKSFEQVFKGTLYAFVGMISVLLMFQENVIGASLLYVVLSLLNINLFSLFVWGFVNKYMTPAEGIKYYIPFAILMGFVLHIATLMGLQWNNVETASLNSLIVPAIALMILATVVIGWMAKRVPCIDEVEPLNQESKSFPVMAAAYLLGGTVMVEMILMTLFKYQVKATYADPNAYSTIMGNFSTISSISTMVVAIVCLFVGTFLVNRFGWRTAALVGSLTVLTGGEAYFYVNADKEVISWLSQGILVGSMKAAAAFLFFPLVQMVYLYFPALYRFRAKVLTEMMVLPIMKILPTFGIQALLVVFGSMAAISFYEKVMAFILLLLLVVACCVLAKKAKLQASNK